MKRICLLLFISFSSILLSAQIAVTASFDSVAIFIGEQTTLSLSATQKANQILQFPIFSDTVTSDLQLVDIPVADTLVLEDGSLQVTNKYRVTAFDSALVYISGLPVIDGTDTFMSNPLSLKVVDFPVDTTQNAITDIKNIYQPPFDWHFFWSVVMIVLISAILIALAIWTYFKYFRKKSDKAESVEEPIDPRTAYEIAIEDLESLKKKQLLQNERYKLYYSELSDILRGYIKRRFAIGALEQSSDELLGQYALLKKEPNHGETLKLLKDILQLSDLVKFAKWHPFPTDNDKVLQQTHNFLELTKVVPPIETSKGESTVDEQDNN